MFRMLKAVSLLLSCSIPMWTADLTTKKSLNLAAIKTMVAAAEAEAAKRNVQVTICIVDESGNLLFLEKADGASLNTIQFAQKKQALRTLPEPFEKRRWSTQEGKPRRASFSGLLSESGWIADSGRWSNARRHLGERR
jgi:hypothetical protein